MTKIKFGQVTNLSDARFAAAAGADYIGFCFDPLSAGYIPPIKAKEIMDWTTGSHIVAEFGNQGLEEIRTISELLNVDVIEVNNGLLPTDLITLDQAIIKKINIDNFDEAGIMNEIKAYKDVADVFHLYTLTEALPVQTDLLKTVCETYQVIWGLPVRPINVLDIIHGFKPYAIHVSGSAEEKTGIKDFDDLNDLLDVIRTED